MDIFRRSKTQTVTIANGANLSDEFPFDAFTMLIVHIPAEWTAASIGFKVASARGGTFLPLYNENGALVQIASPLVDAAYSAPAELAGAQFIKLWSQDGTGSNTNQAADRDLVIDMKA